MLTHKQKDLLWLIHEHAKDDGVPPSFEEMKEELGLKSKSGIHRLIKGLEERGYIKRLPNKARALEILRLPNEAASQANESHSSNVYNIADARSNLNTVDTETPNFSESSTLQIPLYGRIAAGMPIAALADESRNMDIPASMVGQGEHYALEIYGDSMIEAGIHDGDVAIIKRAEQVTNGDIAVCLVEDQDATLKYFRVDQGMVTLTPANRQHQTQVYPAASVQVQGRLSSLIRKY